ncbi:MAG: alr [Ilumatobacteraceae bacterium]|nr:alr [Ilumatobacteraceae bacterium]
MSTAVSAATAAGARWAWAEVDLDAVADNIRTLRAAAAPSAVWAVVKANGYGHGAVPVARAALAAGAAGLCVALVQEGVELREAGIGGRILVLSEQPPELLAIAVAHDLELTVYTVTQLADLAAGGAHAHPVHLKIDTGMRRVGAPPEEAVPLAAAIARSDAVVLAGVLTHLALADEPDDPYTDDQLARFAAVLADLAAAGHAAPLIHAANSAGLLAHPGARRSFVRAGIAVYGISPGPGVDVLATGLRPAMSLHAKVSFVKRVRTGERLSYGLRHQFAADTSVATLPIGYADGVPRRLHAVGGEVLIGGVRRPMVGAITMDQMMVDCGDDPVGVGDQAVLIGRQGAEHITADEWAHRLDTIAYEIVCGISPRIERRYRPAVAPAGNL